MMKYKLISAHNNTSDALFYDMHVTDVKCSKKIPFLLFDIGCMFMWMMQIDVMHLKMKI